MKSNTVSEMEAAKCALPWKLSSFRIESSSSSVLWDLANVRTFSGGTGPICMQAKPLLRRRCGNSSRDVTTMLPGSQLSRNDPRSSAMDVELRSLTPSTNSSHQRDISRTMLSLGFLPLILSFSAKTVSTDPLHSSLMTSGTFSPLLPASSCRMISVALVVFPKPPAPLIQSRRRPSSSSGSRIGSGTYNRMRSRSSGKVQSKSHDLTRPDIATNLDLSHQPKVGSVSGVIGCRSKIQGIMGAGTGFPHVGELIVSRFSSCAVSYFEVYWSQSSSRSGDPRFSEDLALSLIVLG